MPTGSLRRRSSQMPNAKRASMREGPLAALFRKTAEDTAGSEPSSEVEDRALPAAPPPAPEPETPVDVEHHVPSPQERLRHVFSSDIPENVLDPPLESEPAPAPDVY